MAAHVPRRVFAPSFVITVAAVPACGGSAQTTPNPPPPATATDAPSATAPPPSASASAATPEATSWTVGLSDAKCVSWQGTISTASAVAYACPSDVPKGAYPITIMRGAGSQTCTAVWHEPFIDHCPKGAYCNPPPPAEHTTSVTCPK